MSIAAYKQAISIAEQPRVTEYRLVSQITGELIAARDSGLTGAALLPALHRNRELWAVFRAECSAAGNGLPDGLRAAIISLGLWVDRFTSEVVTAREPIDPLIDVNQLILDGLSCA